MHDCDRIIAFSAETGDAMEDFGDIVGAYCGIVEAEAGEHPIVHTTIGRIEFQYASSFLRLDTGREITQEEFAAAANEGMRD